MNDRPSKKLCIVMFTIQGVIGLAANTQDKWPYVIVIGAICIVYKLVQGFIDYKSKE